ncbi:MAG TPA: thiol:disulfide interchange protein DsbA/DsbL [Gallionellaceae bacterium]|nr:thiol:disulfide interchange protein DsbA/DsbL [Gallionellaceae bacterium]HQS75287.1 thiol:disulfide interchange protein DsbA/DsbL [Gallionellaceae bacterium]
MKFFKHVLISVFVLFSSLALLSAQAEPVAGKDYKLVEPAQPTSSGNKIEVLEFFFYGCGHCFHLHPELTSWERKMPKDVNLVFVPTIFRSDWEPMAYTYYALEVLGQNHNLHHDLYEAWNLKNMALTNEADISAFVAKLGVDSTKFSQAYRSFGVQSKVTRSKQLTQTYNIRGTPTLIVDGKYLITGLQPAATIKVLDELIAKARKERASKR